MAIVITLAVDVSATYTPWTGTTTGVPYGQHVNLVAACWVVDEIVNPSQMQTPYSPRTRVRHWCPDCGFDAQQGERLRELLIGGLGCQRPVLVIPERSAVNVAQRPFRNPNLHSSTRRDDARAS